MRFPFGKEKRPYDHPGLVNRNPAARPDNEDQSTIMSDTVIPGRHVAIGTVSAVSPDDDWFNPDRTVQDAPERKDMPRPQHQTSE